MRSPKIVAAALIAVAGAGTLGFAQLSKIKEIGERTADKVENTSREVAKAADAATYGVNASHSSIVFKIKHAGISNFYGRFTDVEGEWTFDPDEPAAAKFDFEIPVRSIETDNTRRDNHLKSGDFFNAAQFPAITFESTGVTATSEGMFELEGNLTLLGKTRKITADLEWLGNGEFRGNTLGAFEARFSIDRTDYGMDFMVGPLGRDVDLIVAVEGARQ